jgi:hypothetical protein
VRYLNSDLYLGRLSSYIIVFVANTHPEFEFGRVVSFSFKVALAAPTNSLLLGALRVA